MNKLMQISPLGEIDFKKVGTHFLVYAIGFGLIAGLQYLTRENFGQYSPVIALVAGLLIDSIRKALDGFKE